MVISLKNTAPEKFALTANDEILTVYLAEPHGARELMKHYSVCLSMKE